MPADEQQLRRLIATLGIAGVSVHDRTSSERAALYQQFIFALGPRSDAEPAVDAARAELVRRLLALPGAPP